jgi:hypothetical protein
MKKLIPTISKMVMGGEPPKKPIYVSDKNDPRLKSYQDSLAIYNSNSDLLKSLKLNKYNKIDENLSNTQLKSMIQNIENFANKKYIDVRNNRPFNDKRKELYTKQRVSKVGNLTQTDDLIPFIINKKLPTQLVSSKILPKGNAVFSDGILGDKRVTFDYSNVKPVQPVEYKQVITPTIVPKPKSKVIPKVTPTVNNKKIQMETTKIDTTPVVQPTIATPPTPLTKKQYYEVPDANGKTVLLTPEQFSRMSSGNKNDLMSKSPIMNKPKYFYEMNSSGKRQLIPESKIREYMQSKNK